MIDIGLAALPNQSLTVQVDDNVYTIAIREVIGAMAADISRNNVPLMTGARIAAGCPLLPYRYQEAGNFLLTVEADALPYWDQFGVTQFLVYLTPEELAAFRAT